MLPRVIKNYSAHLSLWAKRSIAGLCLVAALPQISLADESERFKDTEIRVIRPRFFNKSGRLEVGAGGMAVMNESFIYTVLGTGTATYHLNEEFAVEGLFAYGYSIDRADKQVLFDEFDIKTQIFRTQYMFEGSLLWTPIYGKWQLASGRLIYFDTYVLGGAGQTGIEWRYNDFCEAPDKSLNPDAEAVPVNAVKGYTGLVGGVGQRYFLSRSLAMKIDFRFHRFFYNQLDGECSPLKASKQGVTGTAPHDTLTLLLGASYYF